LPVRRPGETRLCVNGNRRCITYAKLARENAASKFTRRGLLASEKRCREENAEESCGHKMSAHDYQVKKPFDTPKSNENQKTTARKLKNKENRVYVVANGGTGTSRAAQSLVLYPALEIKGVISNRAEIFFF